MTMALAVTEHWSMPRNARSDARKLGPGMPKSDFWANAKEGIDQVGCVNTAQGFEVDYDRVVLGGATEQDFTDFVKSTYRILLTRGLRGWYVCFWTPRLAISS